MHARDDAEVAALAAAHAHQLLESGHELPNRPLQAFWKSSRERLFDWQRHLERCSQPLEGLLPDEASCHRQRANAAIRELFVADILVRVWAAVLKAADRRRNVSHAFPIVENIFHSHLRLRKQALELMVQRAEPALDEIVALDRIRRRAERWTDLLVGPLLHEHSLDEFCFDPEAARQTSSEKFAANSCTQPAAWELVLAGLRTAFPRSERFEVRNQAAQGEVLASVLATFPENAFGQLSRYHSLVVGRVSRVDVRSHPRCVSESASRSRRVHLHMPHSLDEFRKS